MAIQAAFLQPGFNRLASSRNTMPIATAATDPAKKNSWDKAREDDEEGDGGGGTIKGNRGKNAVHAANMKRLTRGGR